MELKIETFRLISLSDFGRFKSLIAAAMEIGATDVHLQLPNLSLPPQVLGSETLARLSLSDCEIDGEFAVSCWRLRSLTLEHVHVAITADCNVFEEIIGGCSSTMEELSLFYCHGVELGLGNVNELRNLRRLSLCGVNVDALFFTDVASRFPRLKDLTVHECYGFMDLSIAASSIRTISFKPDTPSQRAEFHVPNIRKFTYSCSGYHPASQSKELRRNGNSTYP